MLFFPEFFSYESIENMEVSQILGLVWLQKFRVICLAILARECWKELATLENKQQKANLRL